jgi:rhodanese-related sulfurtransferase/mannose-6-phosphate isomerase-like protein (cupin superfamily)
MNFVTEERLATGINSSWTSDEPSGAIRRTPAELATIVSNFASSGGWMERVRLRIEDRWYERFHRGPDYDIWVISWLPGQATGFHDHGESAGAFIVATGVLEEHRPAQQPRSIFPGQSRSFDAQYAHHVRNVSSGPAVSIHAYSPPLTEMTEYELEENRLVLRERASERVASLNQDEQARRKDATAHLSAVGIEQMLTAARAKLRRLTPCEAHEAATEKGAILVDIRPEAQRLAEGRIPGALVVERNVLEWRFDPTSSARLPVATDYDLRVIVFCSEGYTSSLAAASLQELGLWQAADIVGGFQAWRDSGLPTGSE